MANYLCGWLFESAFSIKPLKDKFSGQLKGFGFVEIPNNSEADKAIEALNGTELKEQNLKVNQAKPRSENSSARSRY